MATFSPFVYWAQSENSIFLKIDLRDVKEPDIDIKEKALSFNGLGTGAQGIKKYGFKLLLFEAIKDNGCDHCIKITDNGINITLNKTSPGWWPRLISAPQKPTWLKIDFDKWQSEEDLLDEKVNDVAVDYPDVYKNLMKSELGYIKDFKAVYLPFYNLAMLCAFLYIAIILTVTIGKTGLNETLYAQTYPLVGRTVLFIQHLQALEIMHAYFGYVKGHWLMPLLQIFGRLAILIFNLELEPRLQKMPCITWLFLSWVYGDIIRYIYYILNMTSSKNTFKQWVYPFFKWLRYTAWIILYPIGFMCEAVIVFRHIIYLDAEPRYYLRMPNKFNVTFDLLTVFRLYLLFVFLPGMYFLLKHMYKGRVKALGGSEPFDKLGLGFLKSLKNPYLNKTK
ncbi:very-long-chain (3R)-3-hydroxyacyl-CoA dehydratase isoform X2 [Anthonomus grandis grandis]|uniref:very-long-chain (3R)-3-hydroxyacyl-CoA dehydratase isoform X2 n=1 Tax=Anthonomus grandis grandis TaxID=2921223 RepID=UPI0021656159|nr:very-long-chain (3R)-3-hydroxyacyl-CoA dehydratase isoform X2 [Anthonomus grandis grandis]